MNKIDFILLFDAQDANPNGDPDYGNAPRMDIDTNVGLVTDVCIKRKVRNYVQLTRQGEVGYDIYVKEKAILNNMHEMAYEELASIKSKPTEDDAQRWMCEHYFDIRTFGAVMSTGSKKCGQVRGPVQLSFARSISPIVQQEFSITRCAVTNAADAAKEHTMGRKYTVPYGLYMAKGTINPYLAEQTGFGEADLEVLKEALVHMFDFDASAARPAGSMAVRRLIFFKHDSMLGNAPAHKLYESVEVTQKTDALCPRSISDYDILVNKDSLPAGITVEEIPC